MALQLADRLLTIAVTATLTSAVWIVFGSGYIEYGGRDGATTTAPPARAVPNTPSPTVTASPREAMLVPVRGVRPDQLIDTFRDERAGGARVHEALDIPAPAGTPVIAAAPGTIERLFLSKDGGNTIYLRSNDRSAIHYYAHLQAYAPGLSEGQRVGRGQELGRVGSSGNADPAAPHLHFAVLRTTPQAEWWEPATAIDPYPMLAGGDVGWRVSEAQPRTQRSRPGFPPSILRRNPPETTA